MSKCSNYGPYSDYFNQIINVISILPEFFVKTYADILYEYIYMFSLYQISSIIYSIATKTYFYKYQI
jgi:hypothetical protein